MGWEGITNKLKKMKEKMTELQTIIKRNIQFTKYCV